MTTTVLTRAPYNLGSIDRIPLGEGRMFRIGGREIAVFRPREGGLYATQARCPHRHGPLADGIVGDGQVLCPLHGYGFALATGQPIGHSCSWLETYAVQLGAAGEILIDLES